MTRAEIEGLIGDIGAAETYKYMPSEVRRILGRSATALRAMLAREEAMREAIRECRLADGYAARTGDEGRWDRAFHELCRLEKSARHLAQGDGDVDWTALYEADKTLRGEVQ